MFTPQQFQIIVDNMDSLPQNELEKLLKYFPFQDILNISILDFEVIR